MKETIKIRCSQLGKITGGVSLSPLPLTEKQETKLKELRDKNSQSKERESLEKKLVEIPEAKLSTGAKTYIRELWYNNKFDYQKNFHNKFVDKGNTVEHKSIKAICKYLGVFAPKNEQFLSNDFICGTPDVRINTPIKATLDAKNVYYPHGLQFFESESEKSLYEWQIHGYNFLENKEHGFIARILMNPPEHLLEKEAWIMWKDGGNKGEYDELFYNDVKDYFDFEGKRPIQDRVNLHHVKTTQNEIDIIKKAVELANEYYNELNEQFETRNKDSLKFFNK